MRGPGRSEERGRLHRFGRYPQSVHTGRIRSPRQRKIRHEASARAHSLRPRRPWASTLDEPRPDPRPDPRAGGLEESKKDGINRLSEGLGNREGFGEVGRHPARLVCGNVRLRAADHKRQVRLRPGRGLAVPKVSDGVQVADHRRGERKESIPFSCLQRIGPRQGPRGMETWPRGHVPEAGCPRAAGCLGTLVYPNRNTRSPLGCGCVLATEEGERVFPDKPYQNKLLLGQRTHPHVSVRTLVVFGM